MSLAQYHKKRDFSRTPEPRGKAAKPRAQGAFIIHKHAARRLHYDLRLELDGVLKSWAVPKGPSLDPHDKRLAVHVEDHPLEYGDFEGTIPAGEYGGGAVVLWDRGRWYPEGDPRAGYRAGKLKFRLDGEKLRGGFTLVRMHGRRDPDADNWLLIKEPDEEAADDGEQLVRDRPESVVSGRTVEQIAAGAPAKKKTAKKTTTKKKTAKKSPAKKRSSPALGPDPLPERIAPELATLVDVLPDDDRWYHEIKFDGYRLLARVDRGDIRLITRGDQDWTERLAPLAAAIRERVGERRLLLDGELVHIDDDGLTRFGSLQAALADERPGELVYYVFDLLHLDGHDLRRLPLHERKQLLAALLPPEDAPGRVRLSEHIEGGGPDVLARACELGLEGILAKRRDAPYRSGRTRDWLKIKCGRRQEVVVGGYARARSGPRALGALLVGVFDDDGRLRYAGKVGTGFDFAEAARLRQLLDARRVPRSPFAGRLPPGLGDIQFVRPDLVVEVRFSEWTSDGRMRHPVYEAVREDKPPKQVRREAPVATPPGVVEVLGVPLSNPKRILFPDDRITKRDLAEYYEEIAGWILPHVEERPLSLVRCPDGIGRPCFFQRHLRHDLPAGVEAVELGDDDERAYVYVRDARGLVGLAQIGALELHAWGATKDRPDDPDRLVIDLDPADNVPWDMVKGAATAVRERLHQLDLDSFLKTTGGKGLHLVVPLTPGAQSWAQVKAFARGIARELTRAAPDHFIDVASKRRRAGKVYVDYLRNDRGATSIAPYSPRARPGAFVSTPLRWSELARLASSQVYDLTSVVARLAKLRSDPWRDLLRARQSLTPARLRAVGVRS